MDPLARLGRKDKWSLSNGRGLVAAPPFPDHLLTPGFNDGVHHQERPISGPFTVLILNEEGAPLRLQSYLKGWRPDRITILHTAGDVVLKEVRTVSPHNAWVTEIELVTAVQPLHVYLWTQWPASELCPADTLTHEGNAISIHLVDGLHLALGSDHATKSWDISLCESRPLHHVFETSPLADQSPDTLLLRRLPHRIPEGTDLDCLLHFRLTDRTPIQLACAPGASKNESLTRLNSALKTNSADDSANVWRAYFDDVPQFESSDPFLTNAYWYRWYNLRLNRVETESGRSYVTRGIGSLRFLHPEFATEQIRELSWAQNPTDATNLLDSINALQRERGEFVSAGQPTFPNLGPAVQQLHELHYGAINRDHTGMLRRYADYLLRHVTKSSNPAQSATYSLAGTDLTQTTFVAHQLFSTLAYFRPVDSTYRGFAEGAREGLRQHLATMPPCGLSQALSASPWLDELGVSAPKLADLAAPNSDSSTNEVQPNEPRVGVIRPYDLANAIDGLAARARTKEPDLLALAASLFMDSIRLPFINMDPYRPTSFACYNPMNRVPFRRTGQDDMLEGRVVDLILRHAVGIRPGVTQVNPLPIDVDWIRCEGIPHPEGSQTVEIVRGKTPEITVHPL